MSKNKIDTINQATKAAVELTTAVTRLATMSALNKAWNSLSSGEQQYIFDSLVSDYDSLSVFIPFNGADARLIDRDAMFSWQVGMNNRVADQYLRSLNESLKDIDTNAHLVTEVLNYADLESEGSYHSLYYSDSDFAKARKGYEEALARMTNLISSK